MVIYDECLIKKQETVTKEPAKGGFMKVTRHFFDGVLNKYMMQTHWQRRFKPGESTVIEFLQVEGKAQQKP